MYIPKPNHVTDPAAIADFISTHGFATVITSKDGVPYASHLPVLYDQAQGILLTHLARANEQWQHFSTNAEILCIFHGPHAYITPSWYASDMAVPTWNYAVAHVYGLPTLTHDPQTLRRIVDETTEKYEKRFDNPWRMNLLEETLNNMMKAIVGVSIRITRIEAKFKLGQNRSLADQESMLTALEKDVLSDSKSLAEFIKTKRGNPH